MEGLWRENRDRICMITRGMISKINLVKLQEQFSVDQLFSCDEFGGRSIGKLREKKVGL